MEEVLLSNILVQKCVVQNYWSKYLPKLKEISYPLQQLLRDGKFYWSEIHDRAWTRIKSLIRADIHLYIQTKRINYFYFVIHQKLHVRKFYLHIPKKEISEW